jgi:diacylglycerol kinase (ATP)
VSSILLGISAADWRWIVLAITLVWLAEAFNTAIEQLGDAITVEREARIGYAKDIAAGAVLASALAAAAIGALTLTPYFMAYF